MSVKLGLDAKLFRNTGDYATPTWDETDRIDHNLAIKEVAFAFESDLGHFHTR